MCSDTRSRSDREILTVLEVARFLRVPKSTVYKLARRGQLPAAKVGKHWRFPYRDLQNWMHDRSTPESERHRIAGSSGR
jgi:excisionase family DNA binding protein